MAQNPKTSRNEELVALRDSNKKKWSYSKLGERFGISKITARELYLKWGNKLSTGK